MLKGVNIKSLSFLCVFIFSSGKLWAQETVGIFKYGVEQDFVCSVFVGGEISPKTYQDFGYLLNLNINPKTCLADQNGLPVKRVIDTIFIMNSYGGDVESALNIGRLIKRENLNTHTDSFTTETCFSACVLIYAAGKNRHITSGLSEFNDASTPLGLHKPDFVHGSYEYAENEQKLDRLKYKLIDLYKENNIDERFIIKMFETSFENIYVTKLNQALVWQLINSLQPPESLKRLSINSERKIVLKDGTMNTLHQTKKDARRLTELTRELSKTHPKYSRVLEAHANVMRKLGINFPGTKVPFIDL